MRERIDNEEQNQDKGKNRDNRPEVQAIQRIFTQEGVFHESASFPSSV